LNCSGDDRQSARGYWIAAAFDAALLEVAEGFLGFGYKAGIQILRATICKRLMARDFWL
jgi:hypothetical protein